MRNQPVQVRRPFLPTLCTGLCALGWILCATPAASQPPAPTKAEHRLAQDEMDQWVHLFESPDRERWQKPAEVVEALQLHPGQNVADIGAGSGYFTRLLAAAVGPNGTVWAVDIEPGMLRYIQKTAREMGLANVVTILAAEDDPMLPPEKSDLIFICDTVHHFQDRVAYLRLIRRNLAPHGRLAIIDFHKEDLPVGPPAALKLGRDTVVEEAKKAGFQLQAEHNFLPYQYFLVFTRSG